MQFKYGFIVSPGNRARPQQNSLSRPQVRAGLGLYFSAALAWREKHTQRKVSKTATVQKIISRSKIKRKHQFSSCTHLNVNPKKPR